MLGCIGVATGFGGAAGAALEPAPTMARVMCVVVGVKWSLGPREMELFVPFPPVQILKNPFFGREGLESYKLRTIT